MITSYWEGAYVTFSLATFGTATMLLGAVLLDPSDHKHHH